MPVRLPNFVAGLYFGEQVLEFVYAPGIKIRINAPGADSFDAGLPTRVVLYALPNGNSTRWTEGKLPAQGDDWHYHIQHIGAQTRYLRAVDSSCNYVTVYLEAETRSWGSWRKAGAGRDSKIRETVEYIRDMFSDYNPRIELNSHSGGGNFIFGFMDAGEDIPAYVTRISFLDSDYNWNNERYGAKLKRWLEASDSNCLFVACYDDANALYEGKPFVSKKGGTWYRTGVMRKYLKKNLKSARWTKTENDSSVHYAACGRRVQFYFRKNPERQIYHTVLVERNGYVQSVLSGTGYENDGYEFMGRKAYDAYRQDSVVLPSYFGFPPRRADAPGGREFARRASGLDAAVRDSMVYAELSAGNVPEFLRHYVLITDSLKDAKGRMHKVAIGVSADYVAVGNDSDFLRMPMLPKTAQRVAGLCGAVLPTRRISNMIHAHSVLKLEPQPMTPDRTMTTLPVFVRHDSVVEAGRMAGGCAAGVLCAGHKKDIVISNRIAGEPDRLFIYGWHYPDGRPIQPLSGAHDAGYVDYSHGVRLVCDEVLVDDRMYSLKALLKDPVLYALFSDEDGPMAEPGYVLASVHGEGQK